MQCVPFRLLLVLGAITPMAGCARAGAAPPDVPRADRGTHPPAVREGLEQVRAATAQFRDLEVAVAAGYAGEVTQCLRHADHGGMGYHHLNRELVDERLEIERPEILLFERWGDAYVLNGVEYIVPFRAWPRDSAPPTLMGERLRPSDALGLWYLHFWVFSGNPAGIFSDWNPNVQCQETKPGA